jgi:hypothetical protein
MSRIGRMRLAVAFPTLQGIALGDQLACRANAIG